MSGERSAPGVWRRAHSLALIAVLAAAALILAPFLDYLTDDSYIHFQFAKNLMRGDGFAFNAGEPTYGATSPLWVGLLAAAGAAAPGAAATPDSTRGAPVLAWVAKALGSLFTLVAVAALVPLARTLGWPPWLALLAAALLALHAWSVRWGISGMETPLALALAVGCLALLARALVRGRSALPAGVLLGVATAARPEFWLLLAGGALAVAAAGTDPGRWRGGARRGGALLAGAALGAGPWLLGAAALFGQILPNTSAAKAGAWLDPERALATLRECIRAVLAADLVPVAASVLALAWLAPWRAAGPSRGRLAFWTLALGWPLFLVASYAAAGVQVVSRYLVPAAPAVLLIGVASVRQAAATWTTGRRRAAWTLFFLLYAAQNLGVTFGASVPHARRHAAGLRASLGEMGLWARRTTPPGTRFAAPDIGAFGYYSDRPVLDLFGLVTPAMAPVVVRHGYDAVVWNVLFEPVGRPEYLIDRNPNAGRLAPADDPASPYRFLFARSIPDLGITRPATNTYSLYAIDWPRFDRLNPRVAGGTMDGRRGTSGSGTLPTP